MRKLLAGATVLMLGAGTMSRASAQLLMKGSDTLEDVTKSVINSCVAGPPSPGNAVNLPVFNAAVVGGGISYVGGGSGGGQTAIMAGQQRIAPMSRPLNGAIACVGGTGSAQGMLDGHAEQLLIGLDGIAVVGANQGHHDSLLDPPPAGSTGGCGDKIVSAQLSVAQIGAANCQGLAIDGCDPATGYTFADWKEVLAMLYGGQNHVRDASGALLPQLTATFPKTRNPARINCASPIRKALADNWGTLFETDCGKSVSATNAQACVKLKHAFRRGDLSGTTDTFVTLAAMVAIPAFSKVAIGSAEAIDNTSATANPFCNAGTRAMNKGHSDYLDLDPIRRIADSANAGGGRIGFEQVAESGLTPTNPPSPLIPDLRADPAVGELNEFSAPSNRQNWGPDPTNTTAGFDYVAAQGPALLARLGLGLVLPIEIPTNYADETVAYWSATGTPTGGSPVICNSFAPSLLDAAPHGICPDGKTGLCVVPVNIDPVSKQVITFNCLSPAGLPARPGVRDNRVFNLLVLNDAGKYVLDGYTNPNVVPALAAIRQNRVVTAFFRLHTSQTDSINGNPTIAGVPTPAIPTPVTAAGVPVSPAAINVCKNLTSTDQIGCLVKASPCSIGYAGREAVDKVPNALNSFAYQLGVGAADARPPTDSNIYALLDLSVSTFYPMSRKLFVNKWTDATLPVPATDPGYANQEILYNCFKDTAKITPAISGFHFLPILVTGPRVDPGCPNNR